MAACQAGGAGRAVVLMPDASRKTKKSEVRKPGFFLRSSFLLSRPVSPFESLYALNIDPWKSENGLQITRPYSSVVERLPPDNRLARRELLRTARMREKSFLFSSYRPKLTLFLPRG